ncbi:hypothetical protein AKJ16_DCAP02181 [Drosera capensis]
MEGKKQVSSASSSLPSELFGTKDPSKTDVFSSIFPPQKVGGSWQKQQKQGILKHFGTFDSLDVSFLCRWLDGKLVLCWASRQSALGGPKDRRQVGFMPHSLDKNRASAYRSTIYKDKSSTCQEQRTHPCYLSSSIYYGGQEMYPQSSTAQNSGSYAAKEGEDYDSSGNNSNGASRGNWWEEKDGVCIASEFATCILKSKNSGLSVIYSSSFFLLFVCKGSGS